MTNKLKQDPVQPGTPIVQGDTTAEPVHPTGSSPVVTYESLASYFYEKVGDAKQNQGLEATDETSYYVINLLESFAQADMLYGVDAEGNRRDEALAMILAKAVSSHPGETIGHYRRLGDMSLFISGFFADSLRGRSVGVAYYVDMGQGAYASLSSMMRSRRSSGAEVYRKLYGELSESFADWVEVLREVSESSQLSTPPEEEETDALFERWQRARGRRASQLASAMMRRGFFPSRG